MVETNMIFLFISGIFLLGFFGTIIFRRTKVSDIFFLLIIGFLLGSGLKIIPSAEMTILRSFSDFFGALALTILMFEGGLHLNFYKVIKEFGKSAGFTILVFFLSVSLTAIFLHFIFLMPWVYGFLIGSILGGVSSAVVIPLVKESKAKDKIKILLTLESAITDALCVIIVIALVQIILSKTASIQAVTSSIFAAFAIATVIGAFAGIIWLRVLRDFKVAREYGYLLTLSFLFLVYVVIQFANGNGSFGALIFGLVLGNGSEILKIFKMKEFSIGSSITMFQAEISLFIKTFFFVYLGIIVEFVGINLKIILIVIGLFIIALLARLLAVNIVFSKKKNPSEDREYVASLHARGLAAAVLATYPLIMGINNEFTQIILPISFMIIILTNLSTTILFFITERKVNKNIKIKDDNSNFKYENKINPDIEKQDSLSILKKELIKNKNDKE
ncbi:MAG: cation:proton antiporter [Candidatus ainarchaeum sp.]|nr:cation:proton antiporter [Candidatus ainarchaeum sp.]MDD3975825.1 cation:proton antiporter [Candidatus ainarchaeum sp.]